MDFSDRKNKDLLHEKATEIEVLHNAWTITMEELELTDRIDKGSTAVVWRGTCGVPAQEFQ